MSDALKTVASELLAKVTNAAELVKRAEALRDSLGDLAVVSYWTDKFGDEISKRFYSISDSNRVLGNAIIIGFTTHATELESQAQTIIDEIATKPITLTSLTATPPETKLKELSISMVDGFPRRNRTDLYSPAEKAISDAIAAVEACGAHPFLTEAATLLGTAQSKVADYVEFI